MSFKSQLYNILSELEECNTNSDLLSLSIQDRLLQTLINYEKSISYSKHILEQKNPVMILKRINRSMKDD